MSLTAFLPVANGGRRQNIVATTVVAITKSDVIPIGPCSRITVGGAGNLVLTMWDSTSVTIPVIAGQELDISPKFVNVATTATGLFAGY